MKFFLKTKKNEGIAPLYFEVCKRTPKVKMQFCTYVKVDIQRWHRMESNPTSYINFSRTPEGAKVMGVLAGIEKAVNDLFATNQIHSKEDRQVIVDAVAAISFAEEREKQQQERERREAREREERERITNQYRNILTFYDWFIRGMEDGSVRTHGRQYATHSVSVWKTFGRHLRAFLVTRYERTFEEITPMFKESFSAYLRGKGYMKATIGIQAAKFCALCRAAAKYGYNDNAVSLMGWETENAAKEEKRAAIYLTEDELSELAKMKLSKSRAKVRDMFLVGTHIGQRFSDFSRITKDMVQVVDGCTFLTFTQRKTGREMVIPITDAKVLAILERYDYEMCYKSNSWFNVEMHSILKELAKSVPSLNDEVKTAPTLYDHRTVKKRYECVSSHTARRSAVTNMCKRGELTKREMMAITGHSTEKIFEDYIKLGTFEQAKRIAEKLSRGKVKQVKVNIS